MSDWKTEARCLGHDPEMWFADPSQRPEDRRYAKNVCRVCPVAMACLDYALARENGTGYRWGIYGGLDPQERADMARNRKRIRA